MTGYGKRMAALIAAGFALGGKPQTVGAVHMTHTGGKRNGGAAATAPRFGDTACPGRIKTEKMRGFRRTPEFFIYFFRKAAISFVKTAANYSI